MICKKGESKMLNIKVSRKLFSVTILTIAIIFLVAFNGKAVVPEIQEENAITELDQQECQKLVEVFCKAWINKEYEGMYQVLSKAGMGRMEKRKFIRIYKRYTNRGGNVSGYSLEETMTKFDSILVKVKLNFETEIPPRIISGIHTFNMAKKEGNWGIQNIMSPVIAPEEYMSLPGGSHPGE